MNRAYPGKYLVYDSQHSHRERAAESQVEAISSNAPSWGEMLSVYSYRSAHDSVMVRVILRLGGRRGQHLHERSRPGAGVQIGFSILQRGGHIQGLDGGVELPDHVFAIEV
jgi:hypothetical protein